MDDKTYLVIQANLQKKKLATSELLMEANRRRAAVALIQEPYVGGDKVMRNHNGVRIYQSTCLGEGTVKAAIVVFDQDLTVIQYPKLTTNNIVVVGIRTRAWEITLVSYYFEPDKPLGRYLTELKTITEELHSKNPIIGGDANAHSAWWGGNKNDKRGEELLGTLDELRLHVLNIGGKPTFDTIRGGQRYCSYIDVTACATGLLDRVANWKVDETLTSSDHNGITFTIQLARSKGITITRTTRLYNTKKANWPSFNEKLSQLANAHNINTNTITHISNTTQLEQTVTLYMNLITQACTQTIPAKTQNSTFNLPWWSDELQELKREVTTRRNRVGRAAPVRRAKVVAEYLQKKDQYETEAVRAQTASWKSFCEKQDRESVWDSIYRIIGRTGTRHEDQLLEMNGRALDSQESARALAEAFYPDDREGEDEEEHRITRRMANTVNETPNRVDPTDPPFTKTEMTKATNSFNPKKAPGADGFTADICANAILKNSDLFLTVYNKCLEMHYFPKIWKEATVVILRKPGKEIYNTPKALRPIGLLPVFGKIYEKMLMARVKYHIIPKLSARQFGFMPQRSTEDALYVLMKHIRDKLARKKLLTVVSLDIEGAFDSAWWPKIRTRLAEENCPVNTRRAIDSYLADRYVTVKYAGKEHRKATNKGCVQGSIGGPILWNLILDPLLKGLEHREVYAQAFADDVVLVFCGDTGEEIQAQANPTLAYVQAWGGTNKLKFAPHKTHAMVITNKLKYDTPRLNMGRVAIEMKEEIKLLGVTIDHKLTFNAHINNVTKKAIAVHKQLSRAAKVTWGLHPEVTRTIYTATIEPILLYAASVWVPAVKKVGIKAKLNNVQRSFLQKISRAYRTVSLHSVLILTGILPLDLRIKEAASLYEAKRGVPQLELRGREIEKRAPAAEAPHPAEQTSLEFQALVDEDQLQANSNFTIRIFTDGSKIEGQVGASLSLWDSEAEIQALKLSLPSYCTVYQAELLAVCKATETIARRKESSFAIYSDSMAALQSITGTYCTHSLAVKTQQNIKALTDRGKTVSLFWVKAHAGLPGNERADQLAKEAALNAKVRPSYDLCPISFVKRGLRQRSLEEWDVRYKAGETAGITKIFFPNAVAAYGLVRKLEITGVRTQFMTGHGGFSEYLNRFGCKENPSCTCEPNIPESVPHVLYDCPIFMTERYETEQKIDIRLTVANTAAIMMSKERNVFLKYCENVTNVVKNRNKT